MVFNQILFIFQLMTDTTGNPEEERRTEFYQAPWVPEAVSRYVFSKVRGLIRRLHWIYFIISIYNDVVLILGATEKTRIGAGPRYPTHLKADPSAGWNVKTNFKHAAFSLEGLMSK